MRLHKRQYKLVMILFIINNFKFNNFIKLHSDLFFITPLILFLIFKANSGLNEHRLSSIAYF